MAAHARRRCGPQSCSSPSTPRAPTPSGPTPSVSRRRSFNAVAARGRRFRQAYATVPETLPSHASMMTGLYPAGPRHPRERRGSCRRARPLLAERLQAAGYETAAFVSSFILTRRFGLARGFDVYDDELGAGQVERNAAANDRRGAGLPEGAAGDAAVPLGALLRSARSVHAAGAVPGAVPGRARTSGKWPSWTQQLGRLLRGLRAPRRTGPTADHPRGRPRRGPRRPRRGDARATCSTRARCTCRWSWPARASGPA